MQQGIGIVVSPTEGRSPTDIGGVKNIHFECTYHILLTLIGEDPTYAYSCCHLFGASREGLVKMTRAAIVNFRDLQRGMMLALFDVCTPFAASSPSTDGLDRVTSQTWLQHRP